MDTQALTVLVIYIVLFLYVLTQVDYWMKGVTENGVIRGIIAILYLGFACLPILGAFTDNQLLAEWSQRMGDLWLGFWAFLGVFLLAFHILRFFPWLFGRKKRRKSKYGMEERNRGLAVIVLLGCISAALIVNFYGYYTAHSVEVARYEANLDKGDAAKGSLRVALISDLHLGVNSSPAHIRDMVNKVNREKPDVILVAGDVFNGTFENLPDPDRYAEILAKLEAPEGVYGVYGNCDVESRRLLGYPISPASETLRSFEIMNFMVDSQIQMIEDGTVYVKGTQITCRKDDTNTAEGEGIRQKPEELLRSLDQNLPILVLEHEPADLHSLTDCGADLILSGHTLNGQVQPVNYVLTNYFENVYGFLQRGTLRSIVTSGVGTVCPPIRIGTKSEVVICDLTW